MTKKRRTSKLKRTKTKQMCSGCKNNFYNGFNDLKIKECGSYEGAEVVRRYRISRSAPTNRKSNYTRVTCLSCYYRPGTSFLKEIQAGAI